MDVKLAQPVEKSRNIVEIVDCPKCGKHTCYTSGFHDIPLKFKILFISVTLGLNISAFYCPSCGMFTIKLA